MKNSTNNKTYTELIKLESFDERLKYLYIGNNIGHETFGNSRWLNQMLYTSPEWRSTRDEIIIRDGGCDLGVEGCELSSKNIMVHHIIPITKQDVINRDPKIFDHDNLISMSKKTHNFIHFGITTDDTFVERTQFDTCPWRSAT